MAYIGRDTDKLSNIEVLDAITFDGSSSYTLQKNSVNFTPSSANNVLVSIDGVVQANNFTVSGSTIDFGVAVPSTSTCDWIYHIGVGLITTPADGTVSLAKLSATGTKDATTYLRGDNTFSTISSGLSGADQWRLSANTNTSTNADVTANWERNDSSYFSYIGTGMTESSGIFSFPNTGYWLVFATANIQLAATDGQAGMDINLTTDNSTYNVINSSVSGQYNANTISVSHLPTSVSLIDVTDISNVKIKFSTSSFGTGTYLKGSTSSNVTCITFVRIGDT